MVPLWHCSSVSYFMPQQDVEALARDFLKLEARKSELEETSQKSRNSSEETFNGWFMKSVCKGLQRNCCTLLCCRNNDGGLSKRCRIATRWWAQQPSSIAIVSPMHMCWQQCNLAVFACQNAMKSSEKAMIAVHIGWNISEIWIKKETDSDQNVKLGQTFSMFSYIRKSG